MTSSVPIAPLLHAYFVEHLLNHKRVSPQTVSAYRDTFRLLLNWLRDSARKEPASLVLADIDAPVILSFLNALEEQRGNSVRSRNARLAAIRSFFRFVALRQPESLNIATRVLAIPVKRDTRRLVGYLTRTEIETVLAAPDQSCWSGRRDHALLLTLYNSGARVSEIAALDRSQVNFGKTTYLLLLGKGRKQRSVPLWTKTARVLRSWFQTPFEAHSNLAFPSARGRALSRFGVSYILARAVRDASSACPSLNSKRVSPHLLRHTTAMHLLQAGVDLSVIALWLGHESIETTHIYVEADLATKQRALGKLSPPGVKLATFHPNDALLSFLATL
jgi:integrase/recombinase XerD